MSMVGGARVPSVPTSLNFEGSYGIRSVPTHTEDGIPIRKIYVSNLHPKTKRTELFGLFAQYGFIKSCWLRMGDKGPDKSPSPTYAFITFGDPADAHKALQAPYHEKQLRGRNLRISPADSWHQPAEDEDGQVQTRPYDQQLQNVHVSTNAYVGQSSSNIQPIYEANKQEKTSGNNTLQPVEQSSDCERTYSILDVLNVDCMNHVLSYISLRDLIRSERVSKRWQMIVQEYVTTIRVFKTSWWQHVPTTMTTAVLIRVLQRVGNSLICLHIDHTWSAFTDCTAHTIGKFCPNLEELKVVGTHTKNWNPLIDGCKNLKKLSFISCNKLTDSSLIQIVKKETPLERLIVANNNHVTGLFLTGSNNRNLTWLSLYNCYSLQGAMLSAAIDTLPNITTLRLDVCPIAIWKVVPQILKKLPRLLELSLSEYTFVEGDISLSRRETEDTEFCDALSGLVDLKVINFSQNMFITNTVIKQIARTCSKLESLNISSCNASNNEVIGNSCKGVCDESLAAVCRNCPNIMHLDVSYLASVTDDGLSNALQLHSLNTLTSRGNSSLSSQPFAACLASCHTLRAIDVCGCDIVSEEIVAAAVRALEAHPRKLFLMVAGTRASKAEELPQHKLLKVNIRHNLCNPHLRPDYEDQIFSDSSDDSLDDCHDNDDLLFLGQDDDEDYFYDEDLDNLRDISRQEPHSQDAMLL